jgi:hypothetical protein
MMAKALIGVVEGTVNADYSLSPICTARREGNANDANFVVFLTNAMLMMSRSTDAVRRNGVK